MCCVIKELLGTLEFSSTDSIPEGFYNQKLWRLTFMALLPCWGVWCGAGLLALEISLPNFYPPHVDVGQPVPHLRPPLLVWMNVVSSIP